MRSLVLLILLGGCVHLPDVAHCDRCCWPKAKLHVKERFLYVGASCKVR